jgi:hypothetical protein
MIEDYQGIMSILESVDVKLGSFRYRSFESALHMPLVHIENLEASDPLQPHYSQRKVVVL